MAVAEHEALFRSAPPLRQRLAVAFALVGAIAALGWGVTRAIRGVDDEPPASPLAYPAMSLGTRVERYKTTPTRPLHVHLFEPYGAPSSAVVFFHGGGLIDTPLTQFRKQAAALQQRGMLAVIVEFRVAWDDASFEEAAADAADALRWVRANATDLSLDPTKIVAAGASVGGWLAVNAEAADSDARPNALVLFDPLIGGSLIEPSERYGSVGVPTLMLVGAKSNSVPREDQQRYCDAALQCSLEVWSNGSQGFFNDDRHIDEVTARITEYLVANDMLKES